MTTRVITVDADETYESLKEARCEVIEVIELLDAGEVEEARKRAWSVLSTLNLAIFEFEDDEDEDET